MIIKYKNYTIEDDRNCFILRETLIHKKGKREGEEYDVDEIYPSTIERAILVIIERERRNRRQTVTLEEWLQETKTIHEDLINNIKQINEKKDK